MGIQLTMLEDKKEEQTLLEHIERIVAYAKKSGLNKNFYSVVASNIDAVAEVMELSAQQVVVLSIILELNCRGGVDTRNIASFVGCSKIKTLLLTGDIELLEERKFIKRYSHFDDDSYQVPQEVIESLNNNKKYEPNLITTFTNSEDIFIYIRRLFREYNGSSLSYYAVVSDFKAIIENNPHISFCKKTAVLYDKYGEEALFILLFMSHIYVNFGCEHSNIYNIIEISDDENSMAMALKHGNTPLHKDKIIEGQSNSEFEDLESITFTSSMREHLFKDMNLVIMSKESNKDVIAHNTITSKELFYNRRVGEDVERLATLLSKDSFLSVQNRLEQQGLRKGFACLFYGAPGTGKTETVYQLARETGRDIVMVNISEVKDKWLGESEKRVKQIFDNYNSLLKSSEVAPILLFNEADAVFGVRRDLVDSSVGRTENTIQNILLQEMEKLEGILIATTNLTHNLDKAFERRFLYKIEFEQPSIEIKEFIWHSMLPTLSPSERKELAERYDFSGGQIENISRKYSVEHIITGSKPSFENIVGFCENEIITNTTKTNPIGFVRN